MERQEIIALTKPKVYSVYIGIVEDDANEGEEHQYEDIGEHRTVNVLAGCMEELNEKVEKIINRDEGEYFMGAVVIAVLEHSFTERVKFLNQDE